MKDKLLPLLGAGLLAFGSTVQAAEPPKDPKTFEIGAILAMTGSAAFFKKFAHLFPEERAEAPKPVAATDSTAEIAVALATIRAKRG